MELQTNMEESEQVVEVTYTNIDVLHEQGISMNDLQKLKDEGYHTVESIAHGTSRKLCEVKGISEAKVLKLKNLVKTMVPMEFKTAADALEDRKSICTVTIGSLEFDKL